MKKNMKSTPLKGLNLKRQQDKKGIKRAYNPSIPLRRDFGIEGIYRKNGAAIIDDPDLHLLMKFYRSSVTHGSLLNIGAGTTHYHYLASLEDKLTYITGLDISPKNIKFLSELYLALKSDFNRSFNYAKSQDLESLKMTIEAIVNNPSYGRRRTVTTITKNLIKKSSRTDGHPDLIVGDMYNITNLKIKKYDNILLGFSLFVRKNEKDLEKLFKDLLKILNPNGHLIISDFGDPSIGDILFSDDDLDDFQEDSSALGKYHTNYRLDRITLKNALKLVGYKYIIIKEVSVKANTKEKEKGFFYLLALAKI